MTARFPAPAVVVSVLICILACPALASASYTSTIVGTTATMTGNTAGDTLIISTQGGLFKHNRFTAGDAGFNSDFDFNTSIANDQTLSSALSTTHININAGDGDDTIRLDGFFDLRGAVDGGNGVDTIDYSSFGEGARANLGLGTTGMSATIDADQQVPITTHAGTGTATVTNYNPATLTFDINVVVSGLAPADVTGFHIHYGQVGVNGLILVDFTGVAPLVPAGTGFTFTATGLHVQNNFEAGFLGGATYVNIHTAAFPNGAIRGQLFSTGNVNLPSGYGSGVTGLTSVENAIGSPSSDSLTGSSGVNTLRAADSTDILLGGPGNDVLNGEAGEDLLIWSNGDGSDLIDGGAGSDYVQVNGSTAAGDVFQMAAIGTRIDFDRINLGLFSLDIGTTEGLLVNGLGGNDTFTIGELQGTPVVQLFVSGFEGDDVFSLALNGPGPANFRVRGGSGADTLQGPNGGKSWFATGPGLGAIVGLLGSFESIESLAGGTGTDIFGVRAFATGTPTVNCGAGADTLNYDAEGRIVTGDPTPPDGNLGSPGVQSVAFQQCETVNLNNTSNVQPNIGTIADQAILANAATAALPFTVGDVNGDPNTLIVSANSSNPTLMPVANIVFGGGGVNRTVMLTPAIDMAGAATITVTASDGSLSASTTFLLTVNAPTTVQPPRNLHVDPLFGTTVTIRFRPNALGPQPTGFVLEGGLNPGDATASIPTGSNAPIYTFTAPNGSYYARVHALFGSDRSPASNEIRIHIGAPVPPSAPDLFSAAVNGSAVALAWRNTYGGGEPSGVVLDVTGSATTQIPLGRSEGFAASNVPAGTYTLRLRETNAGGSSAASSPVTVTIPSPCPGAPEVPSNLLVYRLANTVYVVWDPPLSGPAATGYTINVSGSFVGTFSSAARTISGTVGAGSYTISVAAVNPCGTGPASSPQTIVVP